MISIGVLAVIILIHLCSLCLIQTAFVPDEYWQSLEVAHNIVFHYGNLTWEWQEGLRSYIYPSMFALLYYILAFFHMDSVETLVLAPRILQSCISIVSDAYFFCWVARDISGAGPLALFGISSSWFWLFCSSRTLVNTMEASLTTIALYYYPWTQNRKRSDSALPLVGLVGFACMIRPTAVIPWLPLCFHHLMSSPNKIHRVLQEYIFVGLFSIWTLALVDYFFYNRFIITPINFLFVNVLKNVANFYGTHSIHWYVSNGLPTVLGLHIIPFLMGSIKSFSSLEMPVQTIHLLLTSIMFTIMTYSFLPHKEFRFILPLLPMALFVSTSWFSELRKTANRYGTAALYGIFCITTLITTAYLGIFHQRGTLDVMHDLAQESLVNPDHKSLLFLMPCHSTPLYSHLHVNISTRYLTCDPRDVYRSNLLHDEADEFFLSPKTWLENNLVSLPSHVILFDNLFPQIKDFLSQKNYEVFSCYHHAHITQGRVGQAVYVLKYRNVS